MHTTKIRKIGGSLMLAVPPALLDVLQLSAGAQVNMTIDDGRLIIEASRNPSYTLDDLLAQSDYSEVRSKDEQDWLDARAVGRELP